MLMANIVRCLQFWARIGCPLRLVVSETTAFKFLDPLSGIATYPSGALRRAGMSSGSAIDIAVCDGRRGRRGTIWSGVAMHRSRAVLLTPDDSRAVVLADLQIVALSFQRFPRATRRACAAKNQRRSSRLNASSRESAKSASNREP